MTTLVIPAAGLGSRLRHVTSGAAKEMLPLGGVPLVHGALLEALNAGFKEATVVVSPQKRALSQWIQKNHPPELTIHLVEQPEALGVLDAVDRAKVQSPHCAVLYPDYIHLPGQRGLAALLEAATLPGTWFALVKMTKERRSRMGRTAFAHTTALGDGIHRIDQVEARPHEDNALHTTFAELRCERHLELINSGLLNDVRTLDILNELADENLLYAYEMPGEILDTGIPPGYRHSQSLFANGQVRWSQTPRGFGEISP